MKLEATDVTLKLLELTENPVPGGLSKIADELGIPSDNIYARERFYREMRSIIRMFPEEIYKDIDDRDTLMYNCQVELDDITEELEELEEDEEIDFDEEEDNKDDKENNYH